MGNEQTERGCSEKTGSKLRSKGLVNSNWCEPQKSNFGFTEKKCYCLLNKCNGTL